MREITEAQAQELADFSDNVVTQNKYSVIMFEPDFELHFNNQSESWESDAVAAGEDCYQLAIRIKSTRPYSEQIWRPK